jgi:thioredoxin reductase
MKHIAIIGAGIRGMASAACLQQRGHQVRVYDRAPNPGGIWNQVFASSTINTPSFGYTFHPTNRWPRIHPSRDDILANIERLIQAENLAPRLCLNTAVENVTKTSSGLWQINDDSDLFDGLLVCSGYMNRPLQPDTNVIKSYTGSVLLPYDFEPDKLRGKRVVVVGSGATALEMLKLAHRQQCKNATLLARPETKILDLGRTMPLAFAFTGNPLLYRWHRRHRGRPATVAACDGISAVIDSANICVNYSTFQAASGNKVALDDGTSVDADYIIWCTGWQSNQPDWAIEHRRNASIVIASCRGCLDTAGFGHGTSTAHAKALDAILTFGLTQAFQSSSNMCECEQPSASFDQHIVLKLAGYFLQQRNALEIFRRNLVYARRSHRDRWKYSGESRGVKLTSFIQAPFGL